MWSARLFQLSLLAAAGAVLVVVAAAAGGGGPAIATAIPVVALVGTAFVISRGRYRSWGYLEREEDLLVRRGLLVRRLSVVPYGRMQFIDVTRGPVDRLFGLATVQLHTAAARTDARIPGLATAEAERLRDSLTALGEARAQGL